MSVVQTLLEEHADDDPGLSYTGKPIVKWPRRVRMGLQSLLAIIIQIAIVHHLYVVYKWDGSIRRHRDVPLTPR